MTTGTTGGDLHDEIALVEARIEELTEQIERCRKMSLAAKIVIVVGAAWLALTLLGAIPFMPAPVIAALAAVIGGAVLLGSNRTTWAQRQDALRASENLRREMIGRLELRIVSEESPTLH